jgi:hypothetical protein
MKKILAQGSDRVKLEKKPLLCEKSQLVIAGASLRLCATHEKRFAQRRKGAKDVDN